MDSVQNLKVFPRNQVVKTPQFTDGEIQVQRTYVTHQCHMKDSVMDWVTSETTGFKAPPLTRDAGSATKHSGPAFTIKLEWYLYFDHYSKSRNDMITYSTSG